MDSSSVMSRLVSSLTSRRAASVSVSPGSMWPLGKPERPLFWWTMRTLPSWIITAPQEVSGVASAGASVAG